MGAVVGGGRGHAGVLERERGRRRRVASALGRGALPGGARGGRGEGRRRRRAGLFLLLDVRRRDAHARERRVQFWPPGRGVRRRRGPRRRLRAGLTRERVVRGRARPARRRFARPSHRRPAGVPGRVALLRSAGPPPLEVARVRAHDLVAVRAVEARPVAVALELSFWGRKTQRSKTKSQQAIQTRRRHADARPNAEGAPRLPPTRDHRAQQRTTHVGRTRTRSTSSRPGAPSSSAAPRTHAPPPPPRSRSASPRRRPPRPAQTTAGRAGGSRAPARRRRRRARADRPRAADRRAAARRARAMHERAAPPPADARDRAAAAGASPRARTSPRRRANGPSADRRRPASAQRAAPPAS